MLFVPLEGREILGSFPALLLKHLVVLGKLFTLSYLSHFTSPGQNIIPAKREQEVIVGIEAALRWWQAPSQRGRAGGCMILTHCPSLLRLNWKTLEEDPAERQGITSVHRKVRWLCVAQLKC